MAQGGIPVTGITQGGQITQIRFEHVWVLAWIDYFPGRGMTHQSGDSWIPMDASFKQYAFTAGMPLEDNVPFDAQALVNTIEQHATIDEAQGWIRNVPHTEIEQQLSHFQQQLEAYIDQQNPEATVGDVLGRQQIRIIPPRPLAAGLPYRHIATSQSFSEVPDSLRHKFRYALATLFYGEPDSTVLRIEQPTVNLAGKTLALSFRPATAADEAIIAARLPQPDPDTGLIDPNQMPATLTRHDVVGDLMYAAIFGYFALNGVQDQIAAQTAEMITYRLPSYGIFGTRIQTQYLYGVPRTISFAGLSMDVDHLANQTVSKSNDRQQWITFNELTGARASAMEHLVPEMMFSTEEDPAHGISAVKALALAAEQGQRIWTITSDNLEIALPSLSLSSETKTDIRNAVRGGKVVTAHEARINFHGWIGEGYIIIDPETGACAYMISGGANGGFLVVSLLIISGIGVLALSTALMASGGVAAIVVGIIALLVLPFYLWAQAWLATMASGEERNKWLAVVEHISKTVRHGMGTTGKFILEILDPIIDWCRYEANTG